MFSHLAAFIFLGYVLCIKSFSSVLVCILRVCVFCTGIYFEGYSPDPELKNEWWHSPALCEQQKLTDMCQLVKKEVPLVSAAFAGSFLITLSLVRYTCTYSCCSYNFIFYWIFQKYSVKIIDMLSLTKCVWEF